MKQHVTKQAFVYATLRDAIIRCELAPGERLIIDELARKYEVSIIPVREALRLLQSEGLVVSVPHVGATVAPISHDSVLEVFTLLEGLERVGSRAAAERATPHDLDVIGGLVADMDAALERNAPQRWAELNTKFHLAITGAARMPVLQEMLQRALDLWNRIRRHYFKGVLVYRARLAQVEHHAMLDALRHRDLAALDETVRAHNRNALDAYTSYLADRAPAAGERRV
jgi:DNA-binding GntR family transcriptional regulator